MRHLYFWNDVPIFHPCDPSAMDQRFEAYAHRLKHPNCQYHILTHKNYLTWLVAQKAIMHPCNVVVGTRLARSLKGHHNTYFIMPKRIRRMVRAQRTVKLHQGVTLSRHDQACLERMPDHQGIRIIEDVMVTGDTLNVIMQHICHATPHSSAALNQLNMGNAMVSRPISLSLFVANKQAEEALHKQWVHLDIQTKHAMVGRPLIDSTLIRLHDLMTRSLAGIPFIQHKQLLEPFFLTHYNGLVTWIECVKRVIG